MPKRVVESSYNQTTFPVSKISQLNTIMMIGTKSSTENVCKLKSQCTVLENVLLEISICTYLLTNILETFMNS